MDDEDEEGADLTLTGRGIENLERGNEDRVNVVEGNDEERGNDARVEGNEEERGGEDHDHVNAVEGNRNIHRRIRQLRERGRPVTILVIGPAGVGKSTLINAMFGKNIARVWHHARRITSETHVYNDVYNGVRIDIYDTIGFNDPEGRSEYDILLDTAAKHGHFDLILICTKLGDSTNIMFTELATHLHKEMWKRTVVVLTFANIFILNDSLRNCTDVQREREVTYQRDNHKTVLVRSLSRCSITREVLDNIPLCIAGRNDERKLPTTDDWLKTLWDTCINRSSDETRHFLSFYARNRRRIIEAGTFVSAVGAGVGIGAGIGSVVPVAGTAIGAVIGGLVGAGVSLVGIIMGRIFK